MLGPVQGQQINLRLYRRELQRLIDLMNYVPQEMCDRDLWMKLHDAMKKFTERKLR